MCARCIFIISVYLGAEGRRCLIEQLGLGFQDFNRYRRKGVHGKGNELTDVSWMRFVMDNSGKGKNKATGNEEGKGDYIRPWKAGRRD